MALVILSQWSPLAIWTSTLIVICWRGPMFNVQFHDGCIVVLRQLRQIRRLVACWYILMESARTLVVMPSADTSGFRQQRPGGSSRVPDPSTPVSAECGCESATDQQLPRLVLYFANCSRCYQEQNWVQSWAFLNYWQTIKSFRLRVYERLVRNLIQPGIVYERTQTQTTQSTQAWLQLWVSKVHASQWITVSNTPDTPYAVILCLKRLTFVFSQARFFSVRFVAKRYS